MKNLDVRTASSEDLPAIVTLYNLMWTTSVNAIDMKVAQNIFEQMKQRPNHNMYVAVLDGRIVGTFMLLIMENSKSRQKPDGVLENVVVHPKFQRRGVGKQMIGFAMECCRDAGCKRLFFSSTERREDTQKFYESLGFARHGYGYVIDLEK